MALVGPDDDDGMALSIPTPTVVEFLSLSLPLDELKTTGTD